MSAPNAVPPAPPIAETVEKFERLIADHRAKRRALGLKLLELGVYAFPWKYTEEISLYQDLFDKEIEMVAGLQATKQIVSFYETVLKGSK